MKLRGCLTFEESVPLWQKEGGGIDNFECNSTSLRFKHVSHTQSHINEVTYLEQCRVHGPDLLLPLLMFLLRQRLEDGDNLFLVSHVLFSIIIIVIDCQIF